MFSQLGLSPTACASLTRLGYDTPTPIQTEAIPLVLTGVDILARAQTGTGKTAAFGLPMIERLFTPGPAGGGRTPRGLVLVPTRELAVQVHQTLSAYALPSRLRVVAIFGGVAIGGQVQALRRGPDIVVATPGRLIDHLQRRTIDLSAVEVLTLDEADRMLDMGFLPALRRVVASLPRRRQTLLFSATLPEAVIHLSAEFTRDAVRVDVSTGQVVAVNVTHQVHHVAVDRKREVLTHILTQDGEAQALVFCKTKRGANRVGEDLGRRGVRTGVIHGNKSQSARSRALDDFKTGRLRVLVATDIAGRGLDIVQLPLVVNFDLPLVAEDYVHRVGRTGRAGHHGRAVSLVSTSDTKLLREIQRLVTAPLVRVATPVGDVAVERRAVEPGRPMQVRARGGQEPVAPQRTSRANLGRTRDVTRRDFGGRRAGRAPSQTPATASAAATRAL
jgi:ATP-dependent RNA helicase RhlE